MSLESKGGCAIDWVDDVRRSSQSNAIAPTKNRSVITVRSVTDNRLEKWVFIWNEIAQSEAIQSVFCRCWWHYYSNISKFYFYLNWKSKKKKKYLPIWATWFKFQSKPFFNKFDFFCSTFFCISFVFLRWWFTEMSSKMGNGSVKATNKDDNDNVFQQERQKQIR